MVTNHSLSDGMILQVVTLVDSNAMSAPLGWRLARHAVDGKGEGENHQENDTEAQHNLR